MTFKKLRSLQEYKFFDWWWKELTVNEVLNKHNPIVIINDSHTDSKFKTTDDIINYSYKELAIRFDLTKELPYKFIITTNFDGKSILVIKFDHSLTDGAGFIAMISAFADNFSPKLFPQALGKAPLNLKSYIYAIIAFPYLIFYPVYRNLFALNSGSTPFKSQLSQTGAPISAISGLYDFAKCSQITKKLKITFNDMIMSIFSSAIKKYCIDHYKKGPLPKNIITITPIGNRPSPKKIEDIQITNNSSVIACNLELIDDPVKECHKISNEFKQVRNIIQSKMVKFLTDFMYIWMPKYITDIVVKNSSKNFDITFSNVPGPREHLYYSENKLIEMFPLFTPGVTYCFTAIFSYAGHFRTTICLDRILEVDPKLILEYFDTELANILKQLDEGDLEYPNSEKLKKSE